jgi:hypothetical protein
VHFVWFCEGFQMPAAPNSQYIQDDALVGRARRIALANRGISENRGLRAQLLKTGRCEPDSFSATREPAGA